jgi:hypothetical protein
MVNIFNLRLGLLLRILNHRLSAGHLSDLGRFFQKRHWSRRMFGNAFARFPLNQMPSQQPPVLFQMASAYWLSQAIYAAAKLGIADVLGDGSKSIEEIAQAVNADEDSLRRLMRVLCMVNVCQITKSQQFEVTALGSALQSGVVGSLRSMILTLGELHYKAWGHLCESVQTGRTGFQSVFGSDMFDFLEDHSSAGETFNLAMTDFSAFVAPAVMLSYDFSGIKSLIDVGGGCGKLLTSVLEVYPDLQGVVVDLPGVIKEANQRIQAHACRDRCAAIPGNFFGSLPRGGDVYLLSGVIHDWDDEGAKRILKNCRNAMRLEAKVLVIECIMPEGDEPSFSKLLDLNMMVMTGGRERTAREFRDLFDSCGLAMKRIIPTISPLRIIEAVRA